LRLAVIREGKTLLYIPDPYSAVVNGRLEPAWLPVFYNPIMEFNRDLSIPVVETYSSNLAPHSPIRGVDGLAATGARGIRLANEIPHAVEKLYVNDISPEAFYLIKENIRLNEVQERITPVNDDVNCLLSKLRRAREPILYIDIDPFGSPAPYLQQTVKTIGQGGLLAVTATDLAVLEGSKTRPARRKYFVELSKVPEHKEIGLRVLIGYIARLAASTDKSVIPLLTYYADHYYRVYLLVNRGARAADKMLEEKIGFAKYCGFSKRTLLDQDASCPRGERGRLIGPLWIGELGDPDFVSRVLEILREKYRYLGTFRRAEKLLSLLLEEYLVCSNCLFYSLERLSSVVSRSLPKLDKLVERLTELGFNSARTHFSYQGIRTTASYSILLNILLESS
jgi:tRNA (guanine26-N2/guanine27-N2)-dimethyltransferase